MAVVWLFLFSIAGLFASRRPGLAAVPIVAALPCYLVRMALFGIPTTVLEAVLLGSVAGFFAVRVCSAFTPRTPFFFAAIALLAVATVALFVAPDLRAAAGVWRAYFFEPILALPLLAATLKEARARALLLRILAALALVLALAALLQALGLLPIVAPWAAEHRATSVYPFPNAVGLFLGPLVTLFAALAVYWKQHKTHDRVFFAITALIGMGGVAAAQSEGAMLAVFLSLACVGLLHGRKSRIVTVVLFLLMVAAVSLSAPLRATVGEKLTLRDWSGIVRRNMWEETVAMLKTRPITGAGLSGYPAAITPFHPSSKKVEIFQYPHTLFLNIWSELGMLGLIVVAWVAVTFFRTLHLRDRDDAWPLRLAAGLAVLTMSVHGLVDVPYLKNDLAILTWMILLIPWATRQREPQVIP